MHVLEIASPPAIADEHAKLHKIHFLRPDRQTSPIIHPPTHIQSLGRPPRGHECAAPFSPSRACMPKGRLFAHISLFLRRLPDTTSAAAGTKIEGGRNFIAAAAARRHAFFPLRCKAAAGTQTGHSPRRRRKGKKEVATNENRISSFPFRDPSANNTLCRRRLQHEKWPHTLSLSLK